MSDLAIYRRVSWMRYYEALLQRELRYRRHKPGRKHFPNTSYNTLQNWGLDIRKTARGVGRTYNNRSLQNL
jgi:hypothetical protein